MADKIDNQGDISSPGAASPLNGEQSRPAANNSSGEHTISGDSAVHSSAASTNFKGLVGLTYEDRFLIKELIALSDVSVVYTARDLSSDRDVTLKTVAHRDREVRKLFHEEMKKLSEFKHDNVVQFLEYKSPFYVMEFLDGISFDNLIAEGKRINAAIHLLKIVDPLARALTAAHQANIVHGRFQASDVILVRENGQHVVKLIGFGCSLVQSLLRTKGLATSNSGYLSPTTEANFVPSVRDDIFSLGVFAYNSITGNMPIVSSSRSDDGEEDFELILESVADFNTKMENHKELDRILRKAVSLDLSERFESIQQFRSALTNWAKSTSETTTKPQSQTPPADAAVVAKADSGAVESTTATSEQPVIEPTVESESVVPAVKPVVKPLIKPFVKPLTRPLTKPVVKPVVEPAATPTRDPVTHSLEEAESQQNPQPASRLESLLESRLNALGPDEIEDDLEEVPEEELAPDVESDVVPDMESDLAPDIVTTQSSLSSNQTEVSTGDCPPIFTPTPAGLFLDVAAEPDANRADLQDKLIGQVLFDRYAIMDVLAESDVSIIYVAKDLNVDRTVAMKTLKHPEPETVRAFAKEMLKLSPLKHKHMVEFIDFKETATNPFCIMEFVEAPTLSELLDLIKRTETEEQIASNILQICELLEYLHNKGYIHGNLTPSSIMLQEEEGKVQVKIGGFGTKGVRSILRNKNQLELDYGIYPSFEAYQRLAGTAAADIYMVAAIAFKMVTGKLPFETTAFDDLSGQARVESISFLRPDLFAVEVLDKTLSKALEPDPSKNFDKVAEFKEAIQAWIQSVAGELDIEEEAPTASPKQPIRKWSKELKITAELLAAQQEAARLKKQQVQGEQTLAAQFTKFVSRGRRKSPVRTILELVFTIGGGGLAVVGIIYYSVANFETLKATYIKASQRLSAQVKFGSRSKTAVVEATSGEQFDYQQDASYSRWTKAKVVGPARRIEPDGKLIEKK